MRAATGRVLAGYGGGMRNLAGSRGNAVDLQRAGVVIKNAQVVSSVSLRPRHWHRIRGGVCRSAFSEVQIRPIAPFPLLGQ